MWKIRWYVAVHVLVMTAIFCFALLGIQFIFAFMHESGFIGKGAYTTFMALEYVIFNLPSFLTIALPIIGLMGSLMSLGLLAGRSELIAMRAAGISIRQIAEGVLIAGIIIMLVHFVLQAFLGPWGGRYADLHRTMALNNRTGVLLTSKAIWLKDGDNIDYIGSATQDGHLRNVMQYQLKDGVLQAIAVAKSAQHQGQTWQLNDVTTTTLSMQKVTRVQQVKQKRVKLVAPNLLRVVYSDPTELTLVGLNDYIHYREANHLEADSYILAWWKLIFQPISTLIMVLLAVPFVFGPLRSSTVGLRLLIGTGLGFVFYIVNQFFGSFSLVYNLAPIWGVLLPVLVFGALMIGLIWYVN